MNIQIKKETHLVAGNIIYNPRENVTYKVDAYVYHMNYKTELAYLIPVPPFGTSKNGFSITIESMIELEYELIR